jgi:hypothetical protein
MTKAISRGRAGAGMAVPCFCILFPEGTAAQHPNSTPTPTTFNAPGAGTGAYPGAFPKSINDGGVIAGFYTDPNNVYHGFVPTP